MHLLLPIIILLVSCAGDSRNTRPEFANEGNPEKIEIADISKIVPGKSFFLKKSKKKNHLVCWPASGPELNLMFRLFLRDKNDENCFLDSVVPERVRSDKNRTGAHFYYLVVVPVIISTLLHYISFEIWIVKYMMINIDTQRTIQRSSSWAIN